VSVKKYDIIVIGSGGGAKITSPAAKLGLKIAVFEEAALGGTCLNRGCIPSKMLIHPADVAVTINEAAKFDIVGAQNTVGAQDSVPLRYSVNFENLINRISNTVDSDSQKIEASYRKSPQIDFYHTRAKFVLNKIIEANGAQMTADKIFIATGARPQIPDIDGLHGTPFMTSTEALRNTKLPRKMIVIGGGYIAVELGHAYGALGTEVHFLIRSRMVKKEDWQVVDEFERVFSKLYHVHLGTIPTKVRYANNQFTVTFKNNQGNESTLTCDALLVAAGVVPNTDDLGLENTDIQLNPGGFIKVDDHLQTTVPDVFSLGDCVGNFLFRHSVNFEGEYLFNRLFIERNNHPIVYPPVPHAIFTHPQIAGVGKTEDELKKAGIEYVVGLNHYKDSAMGMALRSDHGFVKILIERKTKKLLGAHIIGAEASNMIHMLIAFINMNATLDDLLRTIYIHPALPEIVRNAARKAKITLEAVA